MTRTLRVVAILGGTFDPIHYGHLRLAVDVMTALSLTEVRLVPAGIPPHRPPPVASAEHRFAMTALGCAEFPGLAPDRCEIDRTGPSYSVATLESLHAAEPRVPLALIVGSDAFRGLSKWWQWERLFALAHFIVVERPGSPPTGAELAPELLVHWERRLTTDTVRLERTLAGSIMRVSVTPQPIAAKEIRAELARGRVDRVRGLLPAGVLDYIEHNHLYFPGTDAFKQS
jgi:nicotinate-nucleotide adenylyltransferase